MYPYLVLTLVVVVIEYKAITAWIPGLRKSDLKPAAIAMAVIMAVLAAFTTAMWVA